MNTTPDVLGNRIEYLVQALKDEVIFNRIGFLVRQLIEERLDKGEFLNSDARQHYSEDYAAKREERGLATNLVNLEFSGELLGSLDHAFDQDKLILELGFNRDELARIASYHDVHGAGRNRIIREFMDLTDAEAQIVHDYMIDQFGKKFDLILETNLPGYP